MKNLKEWLNTKTLEYKQAACMFGHSEWIEIPDGAEAFGYTGIVHTFYKDDFRSFFNENTDGQWDERSETCVGMKEPVILWQRDQDEPFLTPETTLNDQYAEIEQARQTIKASWPSIDMQRIENIAKAAKAVADSWSSIGGGAKANTEIHGTVKAKPDFNFGAAQSAKDNVNHPSHYADSAIECIDAMEAMMTPEQFIGYLRGNLFKYQWRYEKKNGIEDLKKAQWYLEKLTVKIAEKNEPF